MAAIDHVILHVKELEPSIDFYVNVMGFNVEKGEDDGPYTMIRVNQGFMLTLAPFGSKQWEHLAFSLTREEFDSTFDRVKAKGIPYGSSYDNVGSNTGPGIEEGARGRAPTLYFDDPSSHLIEIRTYD
jgi:catechol 2,3-dioxygenase-like lactoylglutathione lyase family enzyme